MIRAGSSLIKGAEASAGERAAREAASGLGRPGIAFVFVSGQGREELEATLDGVRGALPGTTVIGCSGGGVVGTGEEVEGEPAVSVLAVESDPASVSIEPFLIPLTGQGAKDGDALATSLSGKIKGSAERAALVLLADPFRFDAKPLLARLRERQPKLPMIGGLAAGPGEEIPVFSGGEVATHAAAGAVLSGPGLRTTVAVAQGCRPLGRAGRATRSEKNLLFEVDGEPALDRLREAVEAGRETKGGAIFCGLGLETLSAPTGSGDYLARNILGVDPKTGAVAVAEVIPPGASVSFLVRDADSAREDLRARVRELHTAFTKKPPAFGLYFDCLGRGEGLYGESHVDAGIIEEELGEFPLAGFFGNGELAPLLGANLLHNYTGALVLFGEV